MKYPYGRRFSGKSTPMGWGYRSHTHEGYSGIFPSTVTCRSYRFGSRTDGIQNDGRSSMKKIIITQLILWAAAIIASALVAPNEPVWFLLSLIAVIALGSLKGGNAKEAWRLRALRIVDRSPRGRPKKTRSSGERFSRPTLTEMDLVRSGGLPVPHTEVSSGDWTSRMNLETDDAL